jgi:ribosome maturation protein Sdo1
VHLEAAWDAAKLKIDIDEPVELQVKRAQPKLIEHGLPIKRAEMEGKLTIPHAHVGASQSVIRKVNPRLFVVV